MDTTLLNIKDKVFIRHFFVQQILNYKSCTIQDFNEILISTTKQLVNSVNNKLKAVDL